MSKIEVEIVKDSHLLVDPRSYRSDIFNLNYFPNFCIIYQSVEYN